MYSHGMIRFSPHGAVGKSVTVAFPGHTHLLFVMPISLMLHTRVIGPLVWRQGFLLVFTQHGWRTFWSCDIDIPDETTHFMKFP